VRPGQLLDGPVGQRLHPVAEGLLALDEPAGVLVEHPGRLRDRATGHEAVGDVQHLRLDAVELLPAPGVGLLEVDPGAHEVPRGQLVAVPPDGVALPPERQQLLGQEPAEAGDRLGRLGRMPLELGPQRTVGRGVDECREDARCRRLAGPPADLGGHLGVLPARRDQPEACRLEQGAAVAGERLRDRREPRVDGAPPLLGGGVHEIEAAAQVVEPTGDHRDLELGDPGLGELQLEPQPLEEGVLGSGLPVVDGRGLAGPRQGTPDQLPPLGEAVGGEVGEAVLVARDAVLRRSHRVQGGVLLDEGIGDRVDRPSRQWGVHRHTIGRAQRGSPLAHQPPGPCGYVDRSLLAGSDHPGVATAESAVAEAAAAARLRTTTTRAATSSAVALPLMTTSGGSGGSAAFIGRHR
jgi:hypothetical protein